MAIRGVVRKSLQIQATTLRKDREHCSADPRALDALGVTGCQQVRVKRSDKAYALYTVSEVLTEKTQDIVPRGQDGRNRLRTDEDDEDLGEFAAEFDSQVV